MNIELFSLEGTGLEMGAAINFHSLRETVDHLKSEGKLPDCSLVALDADLWEVSQHLANMREVARISVCWDTPAAGYRLVLWDSNKTMILSMSPVFALDGSFSQFSLGGRVTVSVRSEQEVSGLPVPIVCLSTLTYGSSVFVLDAETPALAESVVPTWEIVPQIN